MIRAYVHTYIYTNKTLIKVHHIPAAVIPAEALTKVTRWFTGTFLFEIFMINKLHHTLYQNHDKYTPNNHCFPREDNLIT